MAATGIDVVRYLDRDSDRAERLAPLLDILFGYLTVGLRKP
jgi:hypothetical protein